MLIRAVSISNTDYTDKSLRLGDSCLSPIIYLGAEENQCPRLGLMSRDVRCGKMTDKTKYYLLCQ